MICAPLRTILGTIELPALLHRDLLPDLRVIVDPDAAKGFWQVEVVTVEPLWGGEVKAGG